jgi:hypothetical protein
VHLVGLLQKYITMHGPMNVKHALMCSNHSHVDCHIWVVKHSSLVSVTVQLRVLTGGVCGVPQYYQANMGTVSINRWRRISSTRVATFTTVCIFMLCDVYSLQVFLNKLTGALVTGIVSSVSNSVILPESRYCVEINCVLQSCRVKWCFCFNFFMINFITGPLTAPCIIKEELLLMHVYQSQIKCEKRNVLVTCVVLSIEYCYVFWYKERSFILRSDRFIHFVGHDG